MKSRDFAFWLQGFFELGGGADGLSSTQVALVKQHLALVFKHDIGSDGACDHQPLMTFPPKTIGLASTTLNPSATLIC